MSFLDIKDPAEKATLVRACYSDEFCQQRNMVNREMKLAIGDELQTLFHPIGNATKQAAEETRKELAPIKKTLTDIDGALNRDTDAIPQQSRSSQSRSSDLTFGIYRRQDGQLAMGNKVVPTDENKSTLFVDGTKYKLTPGFAALIWLKRPRPIQWNSSDYKACKEVVAQTTVKSFPNRTGTARPHAIWKWKHMLRKMTVPGESIAEEESEDTDDAPDTASIEDTDSSDITSPASTRKALDEPSSLGMPQPSPLHTRSYGKAKKTKDRVPFSKGYGVVYLPGDINGQRNCIY